MRDRHTYWDPPASERDCETCGGLGYIETGDEIEGGEWVTWDIPCPDCCDGDDEPEARERGPE